VERAIRGADCGATTAGVSGSLIAGFDEILAVTRLGLMAELRRSLACKNIIENMMGTVRRISHNVKRWRSAMRRAGLRRRWLSSTNENWLEIWQWCRRC
jgi:hypothetical protein